MTTEKSAFFHFSEHKDGTMRRIVCRVIIGVVVGVCACTPMMPTKVRAGGIMPQNQSKGSFLDLVPALVAAARPSDGPLLIDIGSLVTFGNRLIGGGIDTNDVERAIPEPLRNLRLEQAIVRSEHRREIVDGGIHLRLDSLMWSDSVATAVITHSWTEDRLTSAAIGFTITEFRFRRSGGRWLLQSSEIIETS